MDVVLGMQRVYISLEEMFFFRYVQVLGSLGRGSLEMSGGSYRDFFERYVVFKGGL